MATMNLNPRESLSQVQNLTLSLDGRNYDLSNLLFREEKRSLSLYASARSCLEMIETEAESDAEEPASSMDWGWDSISTGISTNTSMSDSSCSVAKKFQLNPTGLPLIPIGPGMERQPYFGADYTKLALVNGDQVVTPCFGCNSKLACTYGVEFAICPACQTVSPLNYSSRQLQEMQPIGVGLGLRLTTGRSRTAAHQ
jgi:hypothetical protein